MFTNRKICEGYFAQLCAIYRNRKKNDKFIEVLKLTVFLT